MEWVVSMKNKLEVDYHTAKSIRSAIANELARRISITDELVEARIAAMDAQAKYRELVRRTIDEQRGQY